MERTFVTDTLASSVVEFFRAYGIHCEKTDGNGPTTGPEMGSIIGFRGQGLRGGLAFVAPAELVARILPVPAQPSRADLQLRDWSAEIANQLVGRLKNKLSARAIDFDVGTPVCFRGSSIRLSFLPEADGITLDFSTGPESVRVYLDCVVSQGNDPRDAPAPPPSAPRIVTEGDVVLF
jgi:CheY-specific phosphatase CheX